jgi:hypothetical protein
MFQSPSSMGLRLAFIDRLLSAGNTASRHAPEVGVPELEPGPKYFRTYKI